MNQALKLASPVAHQRSATPLDVIVIGAGQAGLSVGYYLAQRGLRFVILDANERVGDVWRKRWDSLKLFTPARFDALVGLPFPAPEDSFPTHEQMADYLEGYAKHFDLPIHNGARVESLSKRDGRYVVKAGALELEADQVIVAMASYQEPSVPATAKALSKDILQLHSRDYKNPSQLRPGRTLIVGAGNSGAEIAMDLARAGREVAVAGRDTGEVPFRVSSFLGRWLLAPLLLRFVFHYVLTIRTPMGRKARPKILSGGGPLIRTRTSDLRAAGATRCARVSDVRDGMPVLADGTRVDVANVIWCTGFHPGFSWIDLPVLDEKGEPKHVGGVVPSEPGLYFVGLHFLYSMSSTMIHGVGRDAARIVSAVAKHAGQSEKTKKRG
jgi:putative flavoprotein involved in K+ transport